MNLLLEGDDLEALLIRARREGGPFARIVRAEKVRRGGVMGFFAREAFEVAVEVPGGLNGLDDDEELVPAGAATPVAAARPEPPARALPARTGARGLRSLTQRAGGKRTQEDDRGSIEQAATLAMARQAAFEAAMASDERAPVQDAPRQDDSPSRRGPSFDPYGQDEVRETLDLAAILNAAGSPLPPSMPLPRAAQADNGPDSLERDGDFGVGTIEPVAEQQSFKQRTFAETEHQTNVLAATGQADAEAEEAARLATQEARKARELEAEEQEAARRVAAEREARIAARAEELRAERAAKAARAAKAKAKSTRATARRQPTRTRSGNTKTGNVTTSRAETSTLETSTLETSTPETSTQTETTPNETTPIETPAIETTPTTQAARTDVPTTATELVDGATIASYHPEPTPAETPAPKTRRRPRKAAHRAPKAGRSAETPVLKRIEIPEPPAKESKSAALPASTDDLDFSGLRPAWARSRSPRTSTPRKRAIPADLGLPASRRSPRPTEAPGALMTHALPGIRVEMSTQPPSGGQQTEADGSRPLNNGEVPSDPSSVRDIPKLLPLPPKARSGGAGHGPASDSAGPSDSSASTTPEPTPEPSAASLSAELPAADDAEAELIAKWADPTGPSTTSTGPVTLSPPSTGPIPTSPPPTDPPAAGVAEDDVVSRWAIVPTTEPPAEAPTELPAEPSAEPAQFETPRLAPVTAPIPTLQAVAPAPPIEAAQPLPPAQIEFGKGSAQAFAPSEGSGQTATFGAAEQTPALAPASAYAPSEPPSFGTADAPATFGQAEPPPTFGQAPSAEFTQNPSPFTSPEDVIAAQWAAPLPGQGDPTITSPWSTPATPDAESATPAPFGEAAPPQNPANAAPTAEAGDGQAQPWSAPAFGNDAGASTIESPAATAPSSDLHDLAATAPRATTVLPRGKARRSKKSVPTQRTTAEATPAPVQSAVAPVTGQSKPSESAAPTNSAPTGESSDNRHQGPTTGTGTEATPGTAAEGIAPQPLTAARAEVDTESASGFKLFGVRFGSKKKGKTKDESVAPVTPIPPAVSGGSADPADKSSGFSAVPKIEASSAAAAEEPPAWETMAARASSAATAGEVATAQAVMAASATNVESDPASQPASETKPAAATDMGATSAAPTDTDAAAPAAWAPPSDATTPAWATPPEANTASQPTTPHPVTAEPTPAETAPLTEGLPTQRSGSMSDDISAPLADQTMATDAAAPSAMSATVTTPVTTPVTTAEPTPALSLAPVAAAQPTESAATGDIQAKWAEVKVAERPEMSSSPVVPAQSGAPASETTNTEATNTETASTQTASTEITSPWTTPTSTTPEWASPADLLTTWAAPTAPETPSEPASSEPVTTWTFQPDPQPDAPAETPDIAAEEASGTSADLTWGTAFPPPSPAADLAEALSADLTPDFAADLATDPLTAAEPSSGVTPNMEAPATPSFPVTESPFLHEPPLPVPTAPLSLTDFLTSHATTPNQTETDTPSPPAPPTSSGSETQLTKANFDHAMDFEQVRAGVQAGLESAEEIANGLALASDKMTLTNLGVPAEWVANLQPGDRFMAVVQMLGEIPEPQIADDVAVIAVIGPPDVIGLEAARTALDLPHQGVPRPVVRVPVEVGPERLEAMDLVAATRPVVVSVPVAADRAEDAEKVREVLQSVQAEAVIAVLDGTRSLDENQRWLHSLGKVDAVALDGAFESGEPAAALRLGLPVVRLDGVAVDRVGWAALLCTQLAVGGATS